MSITFITKIGKDGGLDFGSEFNLKRFRAWCKENIGKELHIEPLVHTRSLSQNSFYWMYLGIIERETGNSANDLHEFFKREFLPPKFIKVKIGEKKIERKIPASTTELSKIEMSDYMDKISAMTNVEIPDTEKFLAWKDSSPLSEENYEE